MKKTVVKIADDFFILYPIDATNTRYIFEPGHKGFGDSEPLIHVSEQSHGIEIIIQNVLTTNSSYGIESEADKTIIAIDESGVINGSQGIHVLGNRQVITNDGKIELDYVGIRVGASGANITNNGSMTGMYAFAIGAGTRHTTITNNGDIHVGNMVAFVEGDNLTFKLGKTSNILVDDNGYGFSLNSSNPGGIDHITNGGTITAATVVLAGAGRQIIENTGTMNGNLYLGGGDDSFDTTTGVLNGTVTGEGGNDVYTLGSTLISIGEGGGGGTDTVRVATSISLHDAPYVGQEIENITLFGKQDLFALGNGLNNLIIGNSGDNILDGYGGFDTLIGGKGADSMIGGPDTTYVFRTGDSGKTNASADHINNFKDTTIIDLTGWDANSKKHGMQDFDFIEDHAFTGHAGQLRAVNQDGGAYVEGDTNGDGKLDFVIYFDGSGTIDEFNFEL